MPGLVVCLKRPINRIQSTGLINRIFRLTTKPGMESWKTNKCFGILSKNRYPCYLIRRFIHRHKHRLEEPERPVISRAIPKSEKKYRSVVYIKGVSEKISKILKRENQPLLHKAERPDRSQKNPQYCIRNPLPDRL